jgi:hypothetical protein
MTDRSSSHTARRGLSPTEEAGKRSALENPEKPARRTGVGDALWELGRGMGLTSEEIDAFERAHDQMPACPRMPE